MSHYEKASEAYLYTQYFKPRMKLAYGGGTLKFGPTYRDKDYHIYDQFDSTAYGAEASYYKNGHFLKASFDRQDTVDDLYDFEEAKFSWVAPLAQFWSNRLKLRYEMRERDYFAVRADDKTRHEMRHKLRGEWLRKLKSGWELRSRLQYTDRDTNLAATAFNDYYGEVMLVYRGSNSGAGRNPRPHNEENENN